MADRIAEQTIKDFGAQWCTYTTFDGYFGSPELFLDTVSPLLSLDDIRGKRIADLGAGSGRFTVVFVGAGAEHVFALEPSEAFDVLRLNTRRLGDRVTLLCLRGDELPPLDLDLVFSYGVLHHIPDPLPVMHASRAALRPGGTCCAWLYGREGNGLYLAVTMPLRMITTRLPDSVLRGVAHTLRVAADLYGAACRWFALPLADYMQNVFVKFDRQRRFLVIFDQLNPAYAKYYREREARELFERAGFVNVRLHHRHGYSWTVTGQRPSE